MEKDQQSPNNTNRNRWIIIAILAIILVGMVAAGIIIYRKTATSGPSNARREDPRFIHDKDRDGISDADEKKNNTSDTEFDTDHDGLSDQAELKIYGTDPVKADTDGDGYPDGYEVVTGHNPRGKN